jgi:hypothetical protein
MAETTFVYTQFSDNTDHYYKGAKRDIARKYYIGLSIYYKLFFLLTDIYKAPSPELSSDDLLRELDIVDIPSKTEPYPKVRVSNQSK